MKRDLFQQEMKKMIDERGSEFASIIFSDIVDQFKMALIFCILTDSNQEILFKNIKQFLLKCNFQEMPINQMIDTLKEVVQKVEESKPLITKTQTGYLQ